MSRPALIRLLREWAALVAVLAVVLGPLALSVSRSLGASEKIAIASGAKPFALCLPGSGDGVDPANPAGGPDCDHCTVLQAAPLPVPPATTGMRMAEAAPSAVDTSRMLRPFPRAPPARGPPLA